MICKNKDSISNEILELVTEDRFDGLAEAIRLPINLAMEIETDNHIDVLPHVRIDKRKGWRNGYKSKSVETRFGKLEISIPQVRGPEFYHRRFRERITFETGI